MKPMRSVLFVPAHREGWAAKAANKGADGVIIDLEDSVPIHLKSEGRQVAAQSIAALKETHPDLGVYVRLNAFETGLTGDDIEAVVIDGLDGVLLPKSFGANDIVGLDALISHFERRNGVPAGKTEIIIPLETAQAYADCENMLKASPRVQTLFAGTARDADVSRSIGFEFTPGGEETLYLRSRVVLACRAAGKNHLLVGVWQDLQDPAGARNFALKNRQLGYRGMVLIHPSHIDVANEIFTPSEQDVIFYQGMIDAFDAAEKQGLAAIVYEGMHIDYAHIKTAREVVEFHALLTRKKAS
jgi:citrate lyase subunit beta / citryl-CoA lyase